MSMLVDVFDTETASLEGGVCEIAIARINENFEVVWEAQSLIDPEREITPSSMGIHHITNEMVRDEPTLSQFMELQGYPFRRDELVVAGHNTDFDCRMVAAELPQLYRKICTFRLARNLWPDNENHKLQTLRYQFRLDAGTAHRAMGDVLAAVNLLRLCAQKADTDLPGLIELCKKPMSPETKIGFGKHRGTKLKDLPSSYVSWLLNKADNLDPDMRLALEAL